MKRAKFKAIIFFIVFVSITCSKKSDKRDIEIKEGTGTVWLSGGLYSCAIQIRMEIGDTLVPVDRENEMKVIQLRLKGDDKVQVKYKELDSKESGCSIGKDCEIIEIRIKK